MAGGLEDAITTGEAAKLCGLSRSTLRRAVAAGQLSAWRTPGQHLRFTRQACIDFLRATGAAELAGRVEHRRSPAAADGVTAGATRAD
ncbi:MAG TPA: excisionase family DNA-binding protein [Candidatus Dormibacteraeota bacterium]|jgi:excisionase family DNA binding protein